MPTDLARFIGQGDKRRDDFSAARGWKEGNSHDGDAKRDRDQNLGGIALVGLCTALDSQDRRLIKAEFRRRLFRDGALLRHEQRDRSLQKYKIQQL